jgi:DNA-binding MarR family transcriptional regulator
MNRNRDTVIPRRRPPRPPPPVSRLETHIGYWLRRAANTLSQDLTRKMLEEELGITAPEWAVMRELYDGDRRPVALAVSLGLTRGAVSRLARRLVKARMISDSADVSDGRGRILALTELGRATVPVAAAAADETDREFFGELAPATRALLLSILRETVRRRRLGAAPAEDWNA